MTEGHPGPPAPSEVDRPTEPIFCLSCGYNLKGICTTEHSTGSCPECGAAFDLLHTRRTLASMPYKRSMTEQILMPNTAMGVGLGVLLVILVMFLLDRTDTSNVLLGYGFLGILLALVGFAGWHGRSTTRLHMYKNWRLHALGEVEVLREMRVHRWVLFSLLEFVVAFVVFLCSSCCMAPIAP